MADSGPTLSVVLRVIEGRSGVERCVSALRHQAGPELLEIIVPVGQDVADDLSAACRAEVVVLRLAEADAWRRLAPASALHARCDVGSARGLAAARGRIIASLEDAAMPSPSWVASIVDAHAHSPHEVIGGPIDVDAGDAAAWAAFWLDFGPYVPPVATDGVEGLSDVNVSYKRAALMAARDVWDASFNEFLVHGALREDGCRFMSVPDAGVTLRRPARAFSDVIRERYHWGRVFGAARRQAYPLSNVVMHVLAVPVLPGIIAVRAMRRAGARPRHRRRLIGAIPALLACSVAWCSGEVVGEVTGTQFS